MEQVWNGYGTDTQLNITFQVLHSMVWNGGVWNGIGDLIRSSGSGSGSGCALALVPDLSY